MDDKSQMNISAQTLLDRLEAEKLDALKDLEKVEKDIKTWEYRHEDGKSKYLVTKGLIERKLKEAEANIEKAKKEKDPQLALSINNAERAKKGDSRFSKGCAVNADDVAAGIEDNQVLMAEIFSLYTIKSGPYAGLPIVCELLSQLVNNALLIPREKLRRVSPQEVQEALSKWPKKK